MRWFFFALLVIGICLGLQFVIRTVVPDGWLPDIHFFRASNNATEQYVLFTGDIFLGRAVERWYGRTQINPLSSLMPVVADYAHTIINFEATVPTPHVPTPDYTFRFSVPPEAIDMLITAGVDAASLANNHSFDFGSRGYQQTREVMLSTDLTPFGHPTTVSDLSVTQVGVSGKQLSVVAVNQVAETVPVDALQALIAQERELSEYIAVYIHWGTEYVHGPNDAQRRLAEQIAAMEVDFIIGHHPHVVQSVEVMGNTTVFYSLGNTVFDQYFSKAVQEGLLVGLVSKAGVLGFELYPISSFATPHMPQLLEGAERDIFLQFVSEMSSPQLKEYIETGFIPLALPDNNV